MFQHLVFLRMEKVMNVSWYRPSYYLKTPGNKYDDDVETKITNIHIWSITI